MKHNLFEYVLKVWVITILIAPLLLGAYSGIQPRSFADIVTTAFLCLIMGGLFSMPGALLFHLLTPFVVERTSNIYLIKIQLAFIGLIMVCLSIYIITGFNGTMVPLLTGIYCVSVVISVFVSRLKINDPKS